MRAIVNNRVPGLLLGILLAAAPAWLGAGEAQKPPMAEVSKDTVAGRLENLNRLITKSSGAKRIKASGRKAALEKYREAAEYLKQARKNLADGDVQGANRLADQATHIMFEAVRLAGDGGMVQKKHLKDFQARANSVNALIDALKRVAREKKMERKVDPILIQIRKKVTDAQVLQRNGKLEEGRKVLDSAYVSAKVTIEQLRGGDTLVRTLKFDSKEEEYHYEIDRNDTHKMLLKVLAEEKLAKNPSLKNRIDQFVSKAQALRKQAEKQASNGDFAKAVTTLEASTKELVRAIRSAGVYIPG